MRDIDKILKTLEDYIQNGSYFPVETDKIELKDLSTGSNWKELYKTTCAFLNSKGGIIVIGIKEDTKTKQFKFTGYNHNNEPIIKDIGKKFNEEKGKNIDLTEYIRPDLIEIKPFLNGHICLVFVEKLPDELKYVFFEGFAYERQITGDHKILDEKILAQKELKEEIKKTKELTFVPNSTLDDLDVDKLNEFIIKLNKDIKVETLKADIQSALTFLSRRRFIRENNPTFLGMLVCGKHPEAFVGSRCQVDCYFNTGNEVASDKKVYRDNIISLMESCIAYVFSKTGTGISVERGGSTLFEYPERVIRETVNNALAHRDYGVDRFVNINIVPNKHVEIRNPGHFRQDQLISLDAEIAIRRIIPLPKAHNPNLADVLKTFDRWEGKGWGMSTLTNYALDNKIDVPYFRLYSENDIGLFINKGKVLDDEMEVWFDSFSKYIRSKNDGEELSYEQKTVLSYLLKSERLNRLEKYTVILTPDNNHFEALKRLEECGLIQKIVTDQKFYPIYIVDRLLVKRDFHLEIRSIFDEAFNNLPSDYKDILDAIYHFSEYSSVEPVSANIIGNYLYLLEHKDLSNLQKFDQFKRKIRYSINRLEERQMILRKSEGKPDYIINKNFKNKGLF